MGKNMTWRLMLDLALLRKRPAEDFDFPLWQANVFIVFLGLLSIQVGSSLQTMMIDTLIGVAVMFLVLVLFVKIFLFRLQKGVSEFQGSFLRSYKLAVAASGIEIVFSVVMLVYPFLLAGFLSEWEYTFVLEELFVLAAAIYSIVIFVYAFSATFGLPRRKVLFESMLSGILSFLVGVGVFILFFVVLSVVGILPESYLDSL
jgi:hypothetical protein